MSIRIKLWLTCAFFLITVTAASVFSIYQQRSLIATALDQQGKLSAIAVDMYDKAFIGVNYAYKAEGDFLRFSELQHTGAPDDKTRARMNKLLETLNDNMDIAVDRAPSSGAKETAKAIKARVAEWHEKPPGALIPQSELDEVDAALTRLIDRGASDGFLFRSQADDTVDASDRTLKDSLAHGMQALLSALVVAVVTAIALTLILARIIVRPIKVLASDIRRLSDGDYRYAFEGEARRDEIGIMVNALNSSITKMRGIIASIKETAFSVNDASGEISDGSADLAVRTEQQASSLEETAAAMEQITETVKQNSRNATMASELSFKASHVAVQGGKVVEDAVGAMSNIERSSQKISDITAIIEEIAFQTNLLALNAAVEAARAGDAGRGFAVVASEVRALAGRSGAAFKEIKALINSSAMEVKNGVVLVNEAGHTLTEIVGAVKQVASIVSDIAAAGLEQSNRIVEINNAISQMDKMTQQNAALVEENSSAAQSLVRQAQDLENLVSFFRVEESGAAWTKAAEAAPPAKAASPKSALRIVKAAGGKSYEGGWEEF